MIVRVMNVLRFRIHDGRGSFEVVLGRTWGKGLNHFWPVLKGSRLRRLTTLRFRRPTGSVRPRGAMRLRVWIRREDVDLFRRRREVVLARPRETMPRRMVMRRPMARVGRQVRIRGGPGAVVRAVHRVRTGMTLMGVMHALIVPVGDGDVCTTVAVSEDHLWGKGVGAVVVRVAFLLLFYDGRRAVGRLELTVIGRVRVDPVGSAVLGASENLYSFWRGVVLCHGGAAADDPADDGRGESEAGTMERDADEAWQKRNRRRKRGREAVGFYTNKKAVSLRDPRGTRPYAGEIPDLARFVVTSPCEQRR